MNLNDFRNRHLDEDIYVLASGKTVDYIANSFFKGKTVIGINQVYKKCECQYLVRKEHKFIDKVVKEAPSAIHFISKGNCGRTASKELTRSKNSDKIIYFDHDENKMQVPKTLPKSHKLVVSHSTITTGIHLAAYMGAKNIILVGHDCGSLDGEPNFKNYHTKDTYAQKNTKEYTQWLKKIEKHTCDLKKLLSNEFKCNIYSLNPFVNVGLEGHVYSK